MSSQITHKTVIWSYQQPGRRHNSNSSNWVWRQQGFKASQLLQKFLVSLGYIKQCSQIKTKHGADKMAKWVKVLAEQASSAKFSAQIPQWKMKPLRAVLRPPHWCHIPPHSYKIAILPSFKKLSVIKKCTIHFLRQEIHRHNWWAVGERKAERQKAHGGQESASIPHLQSAHPHKEKQKCRKKG